MDVNFVCLDLVTRAHAPPEYPGIGPEAHLHEFEGGTWPWLVDHLELHPPGGYKNTIFLSHHPPLPIEDVNLSFAEYETLVETIYGKHGDSVLGFFVGHWHLDLVTDSENEPPLVVVTSAAKQDSRVRVVQVFSDGTVDYDTLL